MGAYPIFLLDALFARHVLTDREVNMRNRVLFILGLAILFLFAGCTSTQEIRDQRITENQQLFNTFSPEVQAKVESGQVDIGFSQEMVQMAWGRPDHIHTRKTKDGVSTVWTYTKGRTLTETERMTVPVTYIDASGKRLVRYRSVWVNWDDYREYTVARIEFMKGLVIAIEQLNP